MIIRQNQLNQIDESIRLSKPDINSKFNYKNKIKSRLLSKSPDYHESCINNDTNKNLEKE